MRVSRAAVGLQLQGVLMAVVGTLGSVPAFLVSGPLSLPARAIIAVVLAVAQYLVFLRRKRNWYRQRAEAASPAELSWSFETTIQTRRRVLRRYSWVNAVMLVVVAAFGLVTGLPVAAVLAGFAAGLLTKARWLRSWEQAAGVVLWVTPDRGAPNLRDHAYPYFMTSASQSTLGIALDVPQVCPEDPQTEEASGKEGTANAR
jgi:hypothetical protein